MTVKLIDYMGNDITVANAARVSFNKRSPKSKPISDKDIKLINYLAKHNHWTPFGHCSAQFHMKAPIFVARQLGKHQVGLVWNEVSRRYVSDDPEMWVPEEWRKASEDKKQGSSDELVMSQQLVGGKYKDAIWECFQVYKSLLDLKVCEEQARAVLPQSTMTEWYWSGSIAAFARVCKLRLAEDTQLETRIIAQEMNSLLKKQFPISWNALINQQEV
jgi:thymidylate synthase (FAD)|tara:strand:- start:296 stop:946 length:651 start_codon:yes stop_codon:yes gene_type:complete